MQWIWESKKNLKLMPLGVPKVPFRFQGQPADWVDIYNRLSRERILFLCSELNDETANQLVGLMIYLNSENAQKEFVQVGKGYQFFLSTFQSQSLSHNYDTDKKKNRKK